jgi:hypothetical protein
MVRRDLRLGGAGRCLAARGRGPALRPRAARLAAPELGNAGLAAP